MAALSVLRLGVLVSVYLLVAQAPAAAAGHPRAIAAMICAVVALPAMVAGVVIVRRLGRSD